MTTDRDLFGQLAAPAKPARIGRRVFLPAVLRAKAEQMRGDGASLEAIAEALGVSVATVLKRLAPELERALPGGRRPGRPQWEPTADERAAVERLAAEGATTDAIAGALGVTPPTLRRHCAAELARGRELRAAGGSR